MKSVKLMLFFLTMLQCSLTTASEYAIGDHLTELALADQFEQPIVVDSKTRWILFSRSMDGAEVARTALEGMTTAQLQQLGLVYVADVSGMPSLILKFVAQPKMQELSYVIALDKEGEATKFYPAAKGTAALLDVDAMQVTQIRYFDKAEALKYVLTELMK
ncbi:hypothetical protein JYB87_17155 [Shewanella avicenniae]|uniref:FAD/FMN-containing dehydrogenase n=1 Tax=Shewanella avicenniae TaxID=2814294 RepID=A0ABX7QPM2_9GAMM|nr:hypothetical protein [Shewanella avicenniae]QSX33422.1 hypothetical protein JYB87_17155 [Shewanella avicenniae]